MSAKAISTKTTVVPVEHEAWLFPLESETLIKKLVWAIGIPILLALAIAALFYAERGLPLRYLAIIAFIHDRALSKNAVYNISCYEG